METAYICDAIRTPIGRYGGALASVRTDDLAAIPIAALMARNRTVDWSALDDVDLRLRQSGRRRQSQCGSHGAAARGIAQGSPGLNGQSPLWIEPRRSGQRSARHQKRRSRSRNCRRSGEHVSRSFRDAQSRRRFFTIDEGRRHHHRLAFRKSADESKIRNGLDAGNRRNRRRRISHRARGSGFIRTTKPAARGRRHAQRSPFRRNHCRLHSAEKGRAARCFRRTSIRVQTPLSSWQNSKAS